MHPENNLRSQPDGDDDLIDLREILRRLRQGIPLTLALGLLAMVVMAAGYLLLSPLTDVSVATRVTFNFEGFSKGEYPDQSKFSPDDIRAPEIITAALRNKGISNAESITPNIRGALSIEGIIPPAVAAQRDKLRSLGQTPPVFIPDEYLLSLTLPRNFQIDAKERRNLLLEIVSVYRQRFNRTYATVPTKFGAVFESLRNADFFEYQLILNREIEDITSFLASKAEEAKSFRSPSTNQTFKDLLGRTEIFARIRLNEVLGLIDRNGLSRDRDQALMKTDYYMSQLRSREEKAQQQASVVSSLLARVQERNNGYVLGIKSQATQTRPEGTVIDQGLVDSLLLNDAYNMLVRKALEADLVVTNIRAEISQLMARKANLEAYLQKAQNDQSALIATVQNSLTDLAKNYNDLIATIQMTNADYTGQKFADAVRVTAEVTTEGTLRPMAKYAAVGLFLGLAAGIGISLLGFGQRNQGKAA